MSKHLAPNIPRTVDLRPAANVFQGAAILLLGSVGAVIGTRAAGDPVWAGAAVGAVIGVVAATFLSGFAVMLAPPAADFIDREESIAKYKTLRRRYRRIAWTSILLGAVGCMGHFASPSAWAISVWLICFIICYGLIHYLCRLLELWRCPGCGELFGRRGVFVRYPHVCAKCNFLVHDEGR